MSYKYYNPNPCKRAVGDCAIRAISKALDVDWDSAFKIVSEMAFEMCDMPSSDAVWGAVLRMNGFYREGLPNFCPDCYSAEKFCQDNPVGTFVLGFGGHVATIKDGTLYDAWDSSQEIPQFFWTK